VSQTGGSGGDDAALLALLILLAARAIDWIAPRGWHLKIIHRWGEKDDKKNEDAG